MRMAGKSVLSAIDRPAWTRFLVAIVGLALAFLAALYSTVTRESGNLWATAALATGALLLAGMVGVTTVPYLARRVVLRRVRDAFDYDVTREGVVYLGLVLLIGVAALNTGNNLLFIVVSAMLAAIVVSGVVSAAVLRALELEVILPAHVFAGTAVMARLTVRNQRRVLPSFSVSVVPPRLRKGVRHFRAERTMFGFPWWRPKERQWLRLPDFALRFAPAPATAPPIFSGAVYFPHVPARMSATAEVQLHFVKRGRYEQEGFGLATRFPFAFLRKTRRIALARELIVYPSVEPTDSSLEVLPMITGEFEAFVRGRGYDLYRIREYQPEDPWRHVDWKATAKTGGLKVREFTREDERKLRIVFDNPASSLLGDAEYEEAIRTAASLAWHFAHESTQLSFAASGLERVTNVYDFLGYLALVGPVTGAGSDDRSILDTVDVTDDYNLILTARPRGSIPTALWACSYIVFLNGGRRSG